VRRTAHDAAEDLGAFTTTLRMLPIALLAIAIGIVGAVLAKALLASAISIGPGGPFGAEGPIIMTGGAFGSVIAEFFPPDDRRAEDAARCRSRGGSAAAGLRGTRTMHTCEHVIDHG
jgi:H+/Cl- antiporter ClcA